MAYSIISACSGCGACVHVCPVAAIAGEKNSLHAIDASLCLECGACGRVCPKTAVLDDGGSAVERLMPRARWKKPVFALSTCISCGACAEKCPAHCIEMSKGRPGGGGALPKLSAPGKCVSCGWCSFYCPMSCIEIAAPAEEASK